MKVILLEELKGKGGEGDVVEVTRGFANNYLLPQRIAILATKGNLKQLEERKHNIAKREDVRIAKAEERKAVLDAAAVVVDARVGDEGQLFGSVTAQQVADAVKNQLGVEIDRRRIEMGSPIKTAGEHTVTVSLYREIKAELKLFVGVEAVEAEEAEVAEDADGEVEAVAEETEVVEA